MKKKIILFMAATLLVASCNNSSDDFSIKEKEASFSVEGLGDTLITLELEPNTNYSLFINDVNIDKIKTNLSGKINFSTTLSKEPQEIKIEKHI